MVHGLAGSAPLLLLTLTVVSSPLAAFFYIAVFGVGSMMGMAIMSLLVSVPAQLTEQFARTNLAVRGLSGLFSVGLGLFIVYENAVLNRLVIVQGPAAERAGQHPTVQSALLVGGSPSSSVVFAPFSTDYNNHDRHNLTRARRPPASSPSRRGGRRTPPVAPIPGAAG